uniref:Uncharacterized protein n=1 Tax=Amphimedon queenslandica TaxID=400682 RepID=A0A1X7VTS8_AMPQE
MLSLAKDHYKTQRMWKKVFILALHAYLNFNTLLKQ